MTSPTATQRQTWITIVRGLAGIAAPWAVVFVVMPHVSAMQRHHAVEVTRVTMNELSRAIDEYSTNHCGQYPSEGHSLRAALVEQPKIRDIHWKGPYLSHIPRDAWGCDFLYLCPGIRNPNAFDITSSGPDCVLGNADDVSN